ncbi:MAG: 2-hydroxyacid dehydrogenase, partial [Oxalobacteraceae bacterium]
MKTAVFSARRYDKTMLAQANDGVGHALLFIEERLTVQTASQAAGCMAVCVFVNDTVDAPVLEILARQGTRLVATRSTGYNHID